MYQYKKFVNESVIEPTNGQPHMYNVTLGLLLLASSSSSEGHCQHPCLTTSHPILVNDFRLPSCMPKLLVWAI